MQYNRLPTSVLQSLILLAFETIVFLWLLILFISVPFIELALLLQVHDYLGTVWTLAIVVITAVIGSALARSQGFRTYRRIQEELATGRMPQTSLVDAIMIFVAGALLFTPGVLTDVFGLSLLLPPCRAFYRQILAYWFRAKFQVTSFQQSYPGSERARDPDVVDSYVDEETSRGSPPGENDSNRLDH